MIKVGAVNYLNTKPLIYGFEQGKMKGEIELISDYPSNVARMLIHEEIDVGLVPVTVFSQLSEPHVIGNYCIGCYGEVASVCIFSDVPINNIQTLLLDYQSMTSVALTRLLMKEHWQIDPVIVDTTEDFRHLITGSTAGLVIGDRAFEQRLKSPFIYDLGLAWKELTGMPFVFAAWISNKKFDDRFVQYFDLANKFGIDRIDEVVARDAYYLFDLKAYYTKYIGYHLDDRKKAAMKYFLSVQ